jgi:hypothetical protein
MGYPSIAPSSTGTTALSTLPKGTTAAGNPTSAPIDANTQALHVAIAGEKLFIPLVDRANLTSTSRQVKATAGTVNGFSFRNTNTTTVYVKFYDKVGVVNPATDVPLRVFPVPGNSVLPRDVTKDAEVTCATAIAVLVVTGAADTDNTNPVVPIISEITYV